jgi:hypothetical protein
MSRSGNQRALIRWEKGLSGLEADLYAESADLTRRLAEGAATPDVARMRTQMEWSILKKFQIAAAALLPPTKKFSVEAYKDVLLGYRNRVFGPEVQKLARIFADDQLCEARIVGFIDSHMNLCIADAIKFHAGLAPRPLWAGSVSGRGSKARDEVNDGSPNRQQANSARFRDSATRKQNAERRNLVSIFIQKCSGGSDHLKMTRKLIWK